MTYILHYARSHHRRAKPPAHAAQPLRRRPAALPELNAAMAAHIIPVVAEETAAAEIRVEVATPERAFNPDNLHIPSPLLPPEPALERREGPEPTPTLGQRLRERLREAYDRLTAPRPAPSPAPAPVFQPTYLSADYAALAWALR